MREGGAATVGVVRHALSAGTGSMIALVAVFAESVVALQLLDADDFGSFVLATVVVMFLFTMSDLGMGAAVTHRVASAAESERSGYVTAAAACRVSAMAIMTLVAIIARAAITDVVGGEMTRATLLVLMMFWATGLEEILIASLRGQERHQTVARLQVLRATTRLGISVTLLANGWGPEALAVSWFVAFMMSAAGAFVSLPERTTQLDPEKIRDLFRFSRGAVFPRLVSYAVTFAPVGLLGRYSTTASVAVFAAAQRLPAGIRTLADSLPSVFYPRMASLLSRAKRTEAGQLLTGAVMISVSLLGLSAVVASFIGGDVLGFVFGSTYSQAGGTFTLLLLALALNMPNWLMGYSVSAAGRPAVPALITLVEVMILLPTEFYLIDRLEFNAAAVAMLVGTVGGFPVGLFLLRRTELRFPLLRYLAQVGVLGACTSIGALVSRSAGGLLVIAIGLLTTVLYVVLSVEISYRHLPGAIAPKDVIPAWRARQETRRKSVET